MKKVYHLLTLVFFLLFSAEGIYAQCNNTTSFGSGTAPNFSTPGPLTFTTCAFAGEYLTINGAIAGDTYINSSDIATDFITIRQGSPGGPVVAFGTTPVTWIATVGGTYYHHTNTDAACGTENVCRDVIMQCQVCLAPPPPPCVLAPYTEDFETLSQGQFGTLSNGWTTTPTSGFRWESEDFGTGSGGTGPLGDNTTGSGIYMYTEASSGGTGAVAEMISPCVDLTGLANPAMKFFYHMVGAAMGELHVDISTDGGATWTLDVGTPLIGAQQAAQGDPYLDQTVSLAAYTGMTVNVRFRGIRGTSFTGDMAVDDVSFFNQSTVDIGITALVNPTSSGLCGAFSAATSVEVTLINDGAAVHNFASAPTTINATIAGPTPGVIAFVHNTGTLPAGSTVNVVIGTANMTAGGTYTFNLTATTTGDGNAGNDATSASVTNPTINGFPFLEDFETLSQGQFGNLANGWSTTPTSGFRWESEDFGTGSGGTGPNGDHTTGSGIYMYTEASSGGSGAVAEMISPCIDFTSNPAPAISFWYHMYGATMGELHLDVSTDNGATWVLDVMPPIMGQQQTANADPYLQETVFLDAFGGQQVLIRFRGIRGSSFTGDMAIDDINLFQQPPCDPLSLTAGTAAISSATACAGEDIDLELTGFSTGLGLSIQWFESTDNVTFTPIPGAITNMHTVVSISGAGMHYYYAEVSCSAVTVSSNTVSIDVSEPLVVSSVGDTRCGSGTVTVQATPNAGSTINWYAQASGGASLAAGNSFSPFVLTDTAFYAEASAGGGSATAPLPAEISGFTGNVRGQWFTSPTSFTITGLRVPGATSDQSIAVVRFNPAVPPPTFAGTTNDFTILYLTQNNTNTGVIPVSIPVAAGDVIGILGQRGNTTSYGPTGVYSSMIAGFPVDLTRMGMQLSLTTDLPQALWQEPGGNLGLIEMTYDAACTSPRVAVSVTVNPAPQVDAGADRIICNGDATILTATGGGYTNFLWLPDSLTGASVSVSPTQNTTYVVIADDGTCGDTDTIEVSVLTIPLELTTDRTTVCGIDAAQLNAIITNQLDYSVASVGFAPIDISVIGTNVSLNDDQVSAALSVGFTFNFYNNLYTDFHISSNGFIAFPNPNINDNGCCTGQTLPNTSASNPHNLIAFAWEDLDPGNGGQPIENVVRYATVGSAPNRILVMEFFNVDHFSNGDNVTAQIHLYEGSNNIEIHTTTQPATVGNHTMGIENIDGTRATVVPGRNAQPWTATNDAYRFSPPSLANYTFSWTPTTGVSDPTIANPTILPPVGVTTVYTVVATETTSNCSVSASVSLDRFDPQITSTTGDTRCGLGIVTLAATGDGAVDWFDQPSGGAKLSTGPTYSPFVTATTDFYVETTVGGASGNVGAVDNSIGGGSNYTFYGDGLIFDATSGVTINTVFVYPGSAGDVTVNIEDNIGTLLYTTTVAVTTPGVKTAIPIGYTVPAGTGYEMNALGTNTGLFRNTAGGVYPYASSFLNITGPINGLSGFYYFFYDWSVTTGCTSPRIPVTATVTPAPAMQVTGPTVICGNGSTTLSVSTGAGDYTTFDWSPSTGLNTTSGTTVIASPTETTTYVVFSSGNVNGCQNVDTITVEVIAPPPINLTASGTAFCDVANAQLDAGGGGAATITIGTSTSQSATSAGPTYISSAGSSFRYSKHASIYTAADIMAAGGSAGTINQISWYKTNTAGYTNGDAQFDIYMKHVTQSQHAGTVTFATEIAGAQLVYASNTQNLNTSIGWQDFVLQNNFVWNGVDNIEVMVEFYRPGAPTGAVNWQYTFTSLANAISGSSSNNTTASRNSNRPNIMLGFAQNLTYAWSPATDLDNANINNPLSTATATTTYTVVITDQATGCTSTDSVQIVVEQTPAPVIVQTTGTNPLCPGDVATLDPGTFPAGYTYSWSNFNTNPTIDVTAPGSYSVEVTSTIGCAGTSAPFILQRNVLGGTGVVTSDYNGSDISCFGSADGEITINVFSLVVLPPSPSFGPFSFSLDGGAAQSSPVFTGLTAGAYVFTVTDSSTGCSFTDTSFTVIDPPQLLASTVANTNVSCFGGTNGSATVNATGGTGAYTYNWLTPVPKQTQTNNEIPAGTWQVVVTDANGCQDTSVVTITQPPLLTATLGPDRIILWGALGQIGCTDIVSTIGGGTLPYSYAWASNDPNNPVATFTTGTINVCNMLDTSFTYTVTVTDSLGCTATATITLLYANIDCSNNQNNTKIKICRVPPGNPANCATICISVNAVPALLANGSYLGPCYANCGTPPRTVTGASIATVEDELNVAPNPTNGFLRITFRSEWSKVNSIQIMDLQGRIIYAMNVADDYAISQEVNLEELDEGVYFVNVLYEGAIIKSTKIIKTE